MEVLFWQQARVQAEDAGADVLFAGRMRASYLSVILEPKGNIQESLLLTAEAAVAVYKAVKKVTGI